jgi:hypothetical protein
MNRCFVIALLSWLFFQSVVAADEASWLEKLKPEVNPDLVAIPDNTWKLLKPVGDPFNHPKTEVGLVYDESLGAVIYFGGCSNGYCNSVCLSRRDEHLEGDHALDQGKGRRYRQANRPMWIRGGVQQ